MPAIDARLVERLSLRLKQDASPSAFALAGTTLAVTLLEGAGHVPPWTEPLTTSMLGALLRLTEAVDDAPPSERIRLAEAATVLSVARPQGAWGCDAAVCQWLGWGGRPAADDVTALAAEVLLCLLVGDVDRAALATHDLREHEDGVGLVLHDWVVARVQGHGPTREVACFGHLCRTLRDDWVDHPTLLVTAAAVATDRRRWRRVLARERLAEAASRITPELALRRVAH